MDHKLRLRGLTFQVTLKTIAGTSDIHQCIYVCVHVCIYMYISAYIYILHTYTYIITYIPLYIHTRMLMHMQAYV